MILGFVHLVQMQWDRPSSMARINTEVAVHSFWELNFLYDYSNKWPIEKHNLCSHLSHGHVLKSLKIKIRSWKYLWVMLSHSGSTCTSPFFLPPCKEQYYVLLILTLKLQNLWPEAWNFSRFCLCENPQVRSFLVPLLHHVHTLTHNSSWFSSLTHAHTNKHIAPPPLPLHFLKTCQSFTGKFTQHHFTFFQLTCTEDWF